MHDTVMSRNIELPVTIGHIKAFYPDVLCVADSFCIQGSVLLTDNLQHHKIRYPESTKRKNTHGNKVNFYYF